MLIYRFTSAFHQKRAERDRASIYVELQQTRGAVEAVGREKVHQWS